MSLKKYEIAVILINYNSSQFTINCIESILEHTNKSIDYQIIVIDNASENEDYLLLQKDIKPFLSENIQLQRSKINTGFGGGNMFGVQFANANYYAFVNNDSLLKNDCLSLLLSELKNNDSIGVCGPMCFKENDVLLPTLDHFASPWKEIFGRKILEKINPKKYINRTKLYTKPTQGQFVSGSFMMIKATDFEQVGGFDTNIFLYFEETDLCKRLAKINKFAFLIPDAQFFHYQGISTPSSIKIKAELKISMLYVIRKHYGFVWHQIILNKLRFQFLVKSVFKPKYFEIFKLLLIGAPLSKSFKTKQVIKEF